MKKNYLLLVANIMLASTLFSQKFNFEKLGISYVNLPEVRLSEDISTYNSLIALEGSGRNYNYMGSNFTEKITLPGFERNADDYDIEIALYLSDLTEVEKTRERREYKRKKKDQEYIEYSYFYKVKLTFPSKVKVRTYDGSVILESEISGSDSKHIVYTDEFSSQTKLVQYWRDNRINFFRDEEAKLIEEYINTVNNKVISKIGYPTNYATEKIGIVMSNKKYPHDYSDFQKAYNLISQGFRGRDPKILDSGNDFMKQAISIWEEILLESDLVTKRSKIGERPTLVCHLNCAAAYLWMWDFEKADFHISEAERLKGMSDKGKVKDLRKMLTYQVNRHNIHPNWTGERKTTPRQGTSILLSDRPDEKTLGFNQRFEARSSTITREAVPSGSNYYSPSNTPNQSSGQAASIGIREGSPLDVLSKGLSIFNKSRGNSSQGSNNSQSANNLTGTSGANNQTPSSGAKGWISYDEVKTIPAANLLSLSSDEKKQLLFREWQLISFEVKDGAGQSMALPLSECQKKQIHNFSNNNYFSVTPCTEGEEIKRQFVLNEEVAEITIIRDAEIEKWNIINLNETMMILESTDHTQENPIRKATYIKSMQ